MAQQSKDPIIGKDPIYGDLAGTAFFGGAARQVREAWGLPNRVEAQESRKRTIPAPLIGAVAVAVAAAAGLGIWQVANTNAGGVKIAAESFPDAALLRAAGDYDADGNGVLSEEEAAGVTKLDLSGTAISDLTGIESFPNLASLDLSGNELQQVDLSALTALVELDISDNAVCELDLTGHDALSVLNAGNNGMQSLTLDGCISLGTLDVSGNKLARLDLSDCGSIQFMDIDAGQNVTLPIASSFFPDEALRTALAAFDTDGDGALSLRERQSVSSLDVSGSELAGISGLEWFENLQDLDVSNTKLTALTATNLPASVTSIKAGGCAISSANLLGLSRLAMLDLSSNPLTELDLTILPRLTWANLSGCGLAGALDVTHNARLEHLDVTDNPGLESLHAWGVPGLEAEGALLADQGCSILLADPLLAAEQQTTPEETTTVAP